MVTLRSVFKLICTRIADANKKKSMTSRYKSYKACIDDEADVMQGIDVR